MTDIKFIPKPRADVIFQDIDGESVILDNSGGLIHQLNATASFVWQHCDASNSIETIANILAENYTVSIEDAIKDVSAVIMNFKDTNLLIE